MRTLVAFFSLSIAATPLMVSGAVAQHPRHRLVAHHRVMHRSLAYAPAPYYESSYPYYRNSYESPPVPFVPTDDSASSIILRRTIKAQSEPGLTSELAPDSRQTATGGPVGGVPGFSGGR